MATTKIDTIQTALNTRRRELRGIEWNVCLLGSDDDGYAIEITFADGTTMEDYLDEATPGAAVRLLDKMLVEAQQE